LLLIAQQRREAHVGESRQTRRETRGDRAKTAIANAERISLDGRRIGHACCKEVIGHPSSDHFKT